MASRNHRLVRRLAPHRTAFESHHLLAEGVGFEPTIGFPMPVFKTGAFNRSATPPGMRCSLWVAHPSARGDPFAR